MRWVRMRRPSDWTIVPDFYRVPVGFTPVGLEPGWTRILVKLSQGNDELRGFSEGPAGMAVFVPGI